MSKNPNENVVFVLQAKSTGFVNSATRDAGDAFRLFRDMPSDQLLTVFIDGNPIARITPDSKVSYKGGSLSDD